MNPLGIRRFSIGASVYLPLPFRAERLRAVKALGGFMYASR